MEHCLNWSLLDSVDIILVIIAIFIGIYMTYKGIKAMYGNKTIIKFFKLSYFVQLTLYFVASIGFFGNLVFDHHFKTYRFTEDNEYDTSALSHMRYAVNDLAFFSYFTMLILLESILFARLIHAFKESAYSMNKYTNTQTHI